MPRPLRSALLLLSLTAAPAPAQEPAPARIDSIFARWDRPGSPGCALGVIRDGRLVYERGYGYANLDHGLRNGPQMVYYVGSISKQFTAATIALLAQEGRLGLDDDVRRYIPELPDYGEPLTIRQLIHHTSGLRDIYTLMALAGLRLEDVMTDEAMIALIARQQALNFAPGTEHLYSNSGYFLLGQVVKRVTGRSLREVAEEKLFRPLGMTRTHFHDQPWTIVPGRALSYGPAGDGFRITYLGNFDKIGAGGLYTTLGDLAKWDANFYEPRVGGEALLRTLHTRGVLDGGDTLSYAFGLTHVQFRGLPAVRHSGALMGFRADFVRFPTERTSVLALCNLGTIDPTPLVNRVAELYLAGRLAPPVTGAAAAAPPAARPGVPPVVPAAAALAAYAGRYRSEELDVVYDVAARADTLLLTVRVHGTRPLRPVGGDRFELAGQATLEFERGADGTPTAFRLAAGRVRDIRFVRVDR